MNLTPDQELEWRRKLLLELARAARTQVRPFIPSKTLRRDTVAEYGVNRGGDSSAGYVVVPYFWALYVHDGRPGFTVHSRSRYGRRQPSVLVWFANPKDDPRTARGKVYPRRERDIVQLTKRQYIEGLRENRRRRARGARPYMIVTKAVLRSTPAQPFFETGLRTFPDKAGRIVGRRWSSLVNRVTFSETDSVRVRL